MGRWFKRFKDGLGRRFALADKLTALLAVVLVAGSLVTVVPAVAANSDVDSNLGGVEVTISRFSEVVASGFNDVMSAALANDVNMDYMKKIDSIMSLGTIGNVLGYASGMDDAENAGNVWTQGTDAASRVMTLETATGFYSKTGAAGDEATIETSLISDYIIFGSALNYIGIDEFRDAQSNTDGMRMITGYLMYAFFILAYSAGSIMSAVLDMMAKFNIFAVFWDFGVTGAETIATMVGEDDKFLMAVKDVINGIKSIRWVIIAILIVLFAATVTFWKSRAYNHAANTQTKLRRLMYRIIIMCIGIPLCGMLYTEAINLARGGEDGDFGVDRAKYTLSTYVFQEFLDFEKWTTGATDAKAFKLGGTGAPTGIRVKYDTNLDSYECALEGDSAGAAFDSSRLVYHINRSIYPDIHLPDADDVLFANAIYGTTGNVDKTFSDFADEAENTAGSSAEAYKTARRLILSYARSSVVSADALNDYFMVDTSELSSLLYRLDGTSENSTKNMHVYEQLFGTGSSEQRIWSYIGGMGDNWIYPNDNEDNIINLAGNEVTATLKGLAFLSGAANCDVIVEGPSGGPTTIMKRTLCVGAVRKFGSYEFNMGTGISAKNVNVLMNDATNDKTYDITYDLKDGGMSPLALYNYLHTKFEDGQITVYSPSNTTNAGVGMMHYSVTTPYSGIPELIQLLYIMSIFFCLGIIGWVFGMSLLMNTLIQALKGIPVMIKMMVGSIQGFAEGVLIAFSIAIEVLITVFLYSVSVYVIDFLIKLLKGVVRVILGMFNVNVDPEAIAIMSGLLSIFVIVWGTFELIKWRQAITISFKSMVTHIVNQVFGTSAQMPTGASSGMMKAGAMLAAGGMAAGALAKDGMLDDVVNDLTGTDLGTSLHDKISEGDWEGAMEDVKDYAGGTYRGASDTADAEAALGGGEGGIGGANSWQTLSDENEEKLAEDFDDDIRDADEEVKAAEEALAEGKGSQEDVDEAREKRDGLLQERAAAAAAMRHANYEKAQELGVADYGDYLREQKAEAEANGLQPVEAADLPDEPSRPLDRDGNMAYEAARDGDARTLRTAAQTYDSNGIKADQRAELEEMIANGADETEIAAAVDNMRQENFGDDADKVVAKINEAAGRNASETYGSSDNTDGNARTVDVTAATDATGGLEYAVTDNSSDAGEQRIKVTEADGQSRYENVTDGSSAKGDEVVTVDMGSAEASDAMAMGYADIRNNMDAVANRSGGMLTRGSGQGGFGETTVSEAATLYSEEQSKQISGAGASGDYGGNKGFTAAHTAEAMSAAGVTDLTQASVQGGGQTADTPAQGGSFINGAVGAVTGASLAGVVANQGGGMIARAGEAAAGAVPAAGANFGAGTVVTPASQIAGAPPAPATAGVSYVQAPAGEGGGTVTIPASADGKTYVKETTDSGTRYVESTGGESGTVYVKQPGGNGGSNYVPLDSADTRYTQVPDRSGGSKFLPASDDGITYVAQNNGGKTSYVQATGSEAPGTPTYVMQRGADGGQQFVETEPGTRYVKSQAGGYEAQGSVSTTQTTVTTQEHVISYGSQQGGGSPVVPPMPFADFQAQLAGGQGQGSAPAGYQPFKLSMEDIIAGKVTMDHVGAMMGGQSGQQAPPSSVAGDTYSGSDDETSGTVIGENRF